MRIKDFVEKVKSSLVVNAIENTEGSYETALIKAAILRSMDIFNSHRKSTPRKPQ